MLYSLCLTILLAGCTKESAITGVRDSLVSFYNGSPLLLAGLTADDRKAAFVYWDVSDTLERPPVGENGFPEVTNLPVFTVSNQYDIHTYPVPVSFGDGAGAVRAGWVYYMRTPAKAHQSALKDTAQRTVLTQVISTQTDRPTTVFYFDSLGKYSAVVTRDEWSDGPGFSSIRVVDLSPDEDARFLRVNKLAVDGIPDSLTYRATTGFMPMQISADSVLNIKLFSRSDTANALARSSFTVQPGHSYTLTIYGYQSPQYYPLADGQFLFVDSKLVLDLRKNH